MQPYPTRYLTGLGFFEPVTEIFYLVGRLFFLYYNKSKKQSRLILLLEFFLFVFYWLRQLWDKLSVTKAIKLVDYYKGTALLVNDMMNGIFLTAKQKELLQKLPEEFSRSEGLEIAIQLEWNPSTFDRFLKKASTKYLIHRHGHYQKAIDKMPN